MSVAGAEDPERGGRRADRGPQPDQRPAGGFRPVVSLGHNTEMATVAFDRDALRDRYRRERDKRLRADGNDQYVEIRRVRPLPRRSLRDSGLAPVLTDRVTATVIGGGLAGLLVGARLRELGVEDVRIVEKGGDFGGTWYWNRYPGAQCDVESYIYLPLLEETGYIPDARSTRRGRRSWLTAAGSPSTTTSTTARLFRPRSPASSGTSEASRWIDPRRTAATRSRRSFWSWATGRCIDPSFPASRASRSSGATRFTPAAGTTSTPVATRDGRPRRLRGQAGRHHRDRRDGRAVVPHLARAAGHLYVFQRTPSSVDVRGNRPTDPDWARLAAAGLAADAHGELHALTRPAALPTRIWSRTAGPTSSAESVAIARCRRASAPQAMIGGASRLADFEKMEQIRARVDAIVQDPATAEALKPWYRQFCKRPCFHDEYLQAFNRPNVTLVDTDGRGVERITETAAWWSGTRVRARLPHLRHGLRGRHRVHAPCRLRRARLARHPAVAALVRRLALAARHARARVSQHVRREPHARAPSPSTIRICSTRRRRTSRTSCAMHSTPGCARSR